MSLIQKIKLFWEARKLAKAATTEVKTMEGIKPGWKSTEFWGKTVMQVIVLLNMYTGFKMDPKLGLEIVSAIEVAYTTWRSLIKIAQQIREAFAKPKA